MVSLIYLLSTRVNLCFAVHKLEKFSSNPVKLNSEGLVHLLRYIRYKNNSGLRYYAKIEDATISELLRQASINTDNQLVVFYDSCYQDCPYTGIITGAYIVFYQVGPIDHCTHDPDPFYQSGAESEYNAAFTSRMAPAHSGMIDNEFMKKDPYVIPEQAPIIIFCRKLAVCMANNCKDYKYTRHSQKNTLFNKWQRAQSAQEIVV